VWDSLFNKYLKDPNIPYHTWLCQTESESPLWKLAQRQDLPMCERAVHAFTFDHFYVRREHFIRMATDLRSFDDLNPTQGSQSNHLPAWADLIEKSDADAIGLWATSVCSNPWNKYDPETDEAIPFPLSDGWEVYDWLETHKTKGVCA